ncbi:hypothetical protein F7D09_1510 [Bifidobacterium leontopitheci]|uniref:Uncharacterized protein n=1 Tax=Bifidobacterium leontopitheci TaxID=2650774 RepID=A0A6I1GEA7_9BIFI|nr:hypothetical protein F7D09_1510 [Bifidobacterium leontopitheci]
MRSGLLQVGGAPAAAGIIPACAGNTMLAHARNRPPWDHPHVCGEHPSLIETCTPEQGSSPRMRGTLVALVGREVRRGIIPAYAGNTSRSSPPSLQAWDHPRVCGEHSMSLRVHSASPGSSPRMRGTPVSARLVPAGVGIIPAYAGNTVFRSAIIRATRDHPRVCGNTSARSSAMGKVRDHPRVCGEHGGLVAGGFCVSGSSPRMRGTLEEHVVVHAGVFVQLEVEVLVT